MRAIEGGGEGVVVVVKTKDLKNKTISIQWLARYLGAHTHRKTQNSKTYFLLIFLLVKRNTMAETIGHL